MSHPSSKRFETRMPSLLIFVYFVCESILKPNVVGRKQKSYTWTNVQQQHLSFVPSICG